VGEGEEVRASLAEAAERHGAAIDLVEAVEPFVVPADAPLVTMLSEAARVALGRPPSLAGMPAWTDAHSFAEEGSQAVVFGPGSLAQAHCEDEWISVSAVVACARVFVEAFKRISELPEPR
jgi:acetylornithine deacetylase/succinyl-diaminopimelate desuccinylase-like protein